MKKVLLLAVISPVALSLPAQADVILCTGMSNAKQECDYWINNNTTGHEIINGARGSWDIVKIHKRGDDYWNLALETIAESGRTPEDIDIIWNKNATLAGSLAGTHADVVKERQKVHDYYIELQARAEELFPNLKAGYHSPRTSGEFCGTNPEPFASDTINAIIGIGDSSGAVTHFDKWHLGPDLSAPDYVASDFTDGCHPSDSGLRKVAALINDFFGSSEPPPPPPPPPPGDEGPVATHLGNGLFTVSWTGEGSVLACGGASFAVSGQSWPLQIPGDLQLDVIYRCRIDQGEESNSFGCRSGGSCRVQ